MNHFEEGMAAYLKKPVKGYTTVTLLEQTDYQWIVQTSSGMEMLVYEDELEQ